MKFWIRSPEPVPARIRRQLGTRASVLRDFADPPHIVRWMDDDRLLITGADTDVSGTYSMVVPPGSYQIEVFAPFRGERGDLLSQAPRDITVSGFTRYDFVLEDANP